MFTTTTQSKGIRHIAAIFCVMAVSTTLAPKAAADARDKKTIVTFNAPVEVPGKVLQPGTYVFKVLDSASNRTILQIWDKDEKHLQATVLGVPDYRLMPAEKPVVNFEERPSGSPEALKAWFYPGENYGLEMVYPHMRAAELAKRTNQNVLSMKDSAAKNMAKPNKTATDASVQEMEKTDVAGVSPNGEPVALEIVILAQPEK
jgi:hypothetical protein